MTLHEYLRHGEREQFAQRVGVGTSYLHQICTQARRPSWQVAIRISAETHGAVSIEELLGTDEPIPLAARLRRDDPILSAEDLQRRALELAAEAA